MRWSPMEAHVLRGCRRHARHCASCLARLLGSATRCCETPGLGRHPRWSANALGFAAFDLCPLVSRWRHCRRAGGAHVWRQHWVARRRSCGSVFGRMPFAWMVPAAMFAFVVATRRQLSKGVHAPFWSACRWWPCLVEAVRFWDARSSGLSAYGCGRLRHPGNLSPWRVGRPLRA